MARRRPPFWMGVALGIGAATAAWELPFVNWHPVM